MLRKGITGNNYPPKRKNTFQEVLFVLMSKTLSGIYFSQSRTSWQF